MSEHSTEVNVIVKAEVEIQRRGAVEAAAMKIRGLLAESYEPIELPGHEVVTFTHLESPLTGDPIELIRHKHNAKPNFVATAPEDHEQVEAWYMYRPATGRLDYFEDDMKDERDLLDNGNYPEIPILRSSKLEAAMDPDNSSPIGLEEALSLSGLLRLAAAQRSKSAR